MLWDGATWTSTSGGVLVIEWGRWEEEGEVEGEGKRLEMWFQWHVQTTCEQGRNPSTYQLTSWQFNERELAPPNYGVLPPLFGCTMCMCVWWDWWCNTWITCVTSSLRMCEADFLIAKHCHVEWERRENHCDMAYQLPGVKILFWTANPSGESHSREARNFQASRLLMKWGQMTKLRLPPIIPTILWLMFSHTTHTKGERKRRRRR